MAIIDDINRTLSNLGRNAFKKAKNVSDSARLSGIIREEEEKQKALFVRIGEYVYENELGALNEPIKEWCDEISASRVRIIQTNEQLAALKGMIKCPQCGASVPASSVFCSACGYKFEELDLHNGLRQEENGNSVCPNCGRKVDKDAAFCTYCGTRIPTDQPQIEETEEIPKDICPNCGNKIKPGQTFCIKCGVKLQEQ